MMFEQDTTHDVRQVSHQVNRKPAGNPLAGFALILLVIFLAGIMLGLSAGLGVRVFLWASGLG